MTVKRGTCGATQLVVTPSGGFAGTPVLTCSVATGLVGTTCAISPGGSASLGLSVPGRFTGFRWWPVGVILAAVLFCSGTIRRFRYWPRREGRERWRLAPSLGAVCLLVILAIGCGSGGGSSSSSGTSNNSATGPSYALT